MTFQSRTATPIRETDAQEQMLKRLLHERWSPRAFDDTPISHEEIYRIFEAGRHVPSSYNAQPWRFIIAHKDDPHYSKLIDCLGDFNQKWVTTAPYIAVAIGKTSFDHNGKENRHHAYDTGAFMAVATLAALTRGIYVHQMAGFSPDKVRSHFTLPDGYRPLTMFVFGHLGETEQLPDDLKEQEDPRSKRQPVDTFLYGKAWGESYLPSNKE